MLKKKKGEREALIQESFSRSDLALESFWFVFLEALPTVYGSAAIRLKWNLGLFSALCAGCWVHFTGWSIIPSLTSFSIHIYSFDLFLLTMLFNNNRH